VTAHQTLRRSRQRSTAYAGPAIIISSQVLIDKGHFNTELGQPEKQFKCLLMKNVKLAKCGITIEIILLDVDIRHACLRASMISKTNLA
jgi:hypothetical protein